MGTSGPKVSISTLALPHCRLGVGKENLYAPSVTKYYCTGLVPCPNLNFVDIIVQILTTLFTSFIYIYICVCTHVCGIKPVTSLSCILNYEQISSDWLHPNPTMCRDLNFTTLKNYLIDLNVIQLHNIKDIPYELAQHVQFGKLTPGLLLKLDRARDHSTAGIFLFLCFFKHLLIFLVHNNQQL